MAGRNLFWIKQPGAGRLAIGPRPRPRLALADDIAAWRLAGVDLVVSLLEPAEIAELGLAQEETLCGLAEIAFASYPLPDHAPPPSLTAADDLARDLAKRVVAGAGVLIHCRAGIGRSATIAACTLVRLGHPADDALNRIARARGLRVPETQEQLEFITRFAAYAAAGTLGN